MDETLTAMLGSYPDTTVIYGNNGFLELEYLISHRQPHIVAVFTGRRSADISGAWQHVGKALVHCECSVVRFADIEPEPSTETIERMTAFLNEHQPDEVIAVGGGSIMDAAKTAWAVYQSKLSLTEITGINKLTERGIKIPGIVCIPTTAGTGSEVTQYANIVDHSVGVKKLLADRQLIPRYAFIIPQLTDSLPTDVTLATALDALAHAIEGLLNDDKDLTCSVNEWALTAIKLIVNNLPLLLHSPDNHHCREQLAAAACLGGMVIRYKPTGLPHLCSYSWFGKMAHGIAVAVLLPYAMDYYRHAPAVVPRIMRLQEIFPGNNPSEIIASYVNFLKSCGVAAALKDYPEITEPLLKQTAAGAGQNKIKLELAPRPVPVNKSRDILLMILTHAFDGRFEENC